MNVTLPADLKEQVDRELAAGRFRNPDELIEHAVRQLLDEDRRGKGRLDALRRIGESVDRAGLYEKVSVPGQE